MTLRVSVHTMAGGQDKEAGTITLTDGKLAAEPDSALLREILADDIVAPDGAGGLERLDASDPERFLRALHYQYKSAYLRVSEAEEV